MRVLLLLALGLGITAALAQAEDQPGKSSRNRSSDAPAEEVQPRNKFGGLRVKQPAAAEMSDAEVKALMKKASYVFGVNIGRNMKEQEMDIDTDSLARGLADALAGKEPEMSDEEMQQVMVAMQNIIVARQRAMAKTAGDKNKKEGAAFLAANMKKEGVKTTSSGLQYKVLKSGKGASPKASDTVTTHYKGTLLNDEEFDSSYKRGEPTSFPVNGVIPGWTEALQMMKVGDKWRLFVPAELAYGERGYPPAIPPNATLIFEIELLDVNQ
ncbi:MAG TPA: FKBP-type peptidyl-prolyl cis-trans isomerase [Pirellulales bacterium]|jgi:FKBP-type peptidyl-prolyl cis-trans isomerase FklB|nr:FKBP-type peptidyl-prolyl cis-trans isomerase [Pirellulales bacterium]